MRTHTSVRYFNVKKQANALVARDRIDNEFIMYVEECRWPISNDDVDRFGCVLMFDVRWFFSVPHLHFADLNLNSFGEREKKRVHGEIVNVWLAGWMDSGHESIWSDLILLPRTQFLREIKTQNIQTEWNQQTVECFKLEYVWRRRKKKHAKTGNKFDGDSGVHIKRPIIAFSQASQANIVRCSCACVRFFVVVVVVRLFIGVNRKHFKSQSMSTWEKCLISDKYVGARSWDARVSYTWICITVAFQRKSPWI